MINFVSYIILYFVLLYTYSYYIFPIYDYVDFELNINCIKIFISIIILFLFTLLLPSKPQKVYDILINLHFIFPLFFMLVLYSAENFSSYYLLITIFCFFVIIGLNKLELPIKSIKIFKIDIFHMVNILILIAFSIFVVLIRTYKEYFNLNIFKVHEYRIQIRELQKGIFYYLVNSILPILLSILFTYFLIYRKKFLTMIIFLAFVLLFGFSSHRKYLFLPFLLYGINWIVKCKYFVSTLNFGLIILVVFAIIIDYFWLEGWVKSIVIRRFMFIPAQLNFYYYEFFSHNPKVFWTDSKWLLINKIIEYPYSLPMPMVIGETYFNNPQAHANTGWIGSGYAHAGFLGMLLYAIIVSLVFKYLDFKEKTLDKNFIVVSFSPFIVSMFLSSDLKTVFLSHGLFVYIIIISMMKQRSYCV